MIEIELSTLQGKAILVWMMVVVLVLGLGLLGREMTPDGDIVLSWSEWQVMKVSRVYNAELSQLQKSAESLAELVDDHPDPVRAQIITDQVMDRASSGEDALKLQRVAVTGAAMIVRDWSVGAQTHEVALDTIAEAETLLVEAER